MADLTEKQIAIGNGAPTPEATMYVTCHQCDNCGHIGVNDERATESACNLRACGWHGPSPTEDLCPGCGEKGTMSTACPQCGEHYVLLAESHLPCAVTNIEPTDAMVDAACDALGLCAEDKADEDIRQEYRVAYRAMAFAAGVPAAERVGAQGWKNVAKALRDLGETDDRIKELAQRYGLETDGVPAVPAIKVQFGPEAFRFDSFQQWVNKAQSWFQTRIPEPARSRRRYVAVDAAGSVCLIGADFMRARDRGTFPVVVYLIDAAAEGQR